MAYSTILIYRLLQFRAPVKYLPHLAPYNMVASPLGYKKIFSIFSLRNANNWRPLTRWLRISQAAFGLPEGVKLYLFAKIRWNMFKLAEHSATYNIACNTLQ